MNFSLDINAIVAREARSFCREGRHLHSAILASTEIERPEEAF